MIEVVAVAVTIVASVSTVGLVWAVGRALGAGRDAQEALGAQLRAEALRQKVELERDHLLAHRAEQDTKIKQLEDELRQQDKLLNRAYARLKEHIDDAKDADLVDLSRAVFSMRASLSDADRAAASAGGDSPAPAEAVPDTAPTG